MFNDESFKIRVSNQSPCDVDSLKNFNKSDLINNDVHVNLVFDKLIITYVFDEKRIEFLIIPDFNEDTGELIEKSLNKLTNKAITKAKKIIHKLNLNGFYFIVYHEDTEPILPDYKHWDIAFYGGEDWIKTHIINMIEQKYNIIKQGKKHTNFVVKNGALFSPDDFNKKYIKEFELFKEITIIRIFRLLEAMGCVVVDEENSWYLIKIKPDSCFNEIFDTLFETMFYYGYYYEKAIDYTLFLKYSVDAVKKDKEFHKKNKEMPSILAITDQFKVYGWFKETLVLTEALQLLKNNMHAIRRGVVPNFKHSVDIAEQKYYFRLLMYKAEQDAKDCFEELVRGMLTFPIVPYRRACARCLSSAGITKSEWNGQYKETAKKVFDSVKELKTKIKDKNVLFGSLENNVLVNKNNIDEVSKYDAKLEYEVS